MAHAKRGGELKIQSLSQRRCLNPHPEKVTAQQFIEKDFFDARDLVQVKYEMLRQVEQERRPVTQAAAAYGHSRQAYYAAKARLAKDGLPGLVPRARGPRGGHKLSEEILSFVEEHLAADSSLTAQQLVQRIENRFRVTVHSASIRRALKRWKKGALP